jgi:hypothetical protein
MANSRAKKMDYMKKMRLLIESEEELIKQFCLVFCASKRNAKEILDIVK